MGFGQTPTTTAQPTLPVNQFPLGSVAEPGRTNGDLTALEGGPGTVDSNLNRTAPASMYVKDGSDVTQGVKNDPAASDSTSAWSVVSLLKGIYAKLAGTLGISGSVSVSNLPGTQPVSGTITEVNSAASKADLDLIAAQTTLTPNVSDRWARLVGQVDLARVLGAALSNTNPVPSQDIEQVGYIALTTPPAATTVGADTPLTFSSQVSRVIIQNNTSANVYYAFDTAATLGSLVLTPGSFLVYPKKCTVLHLYTAAAQNINGTAAGGIVVLGAN